MNKEHVKNHYEVTKNYSETARAFGVSPQRVQQIITGYSSYKRKTDWWFNDPELDWSKSDNEIAADTGQKLPCIRAARRRIERGKMAWVTPRAKLSICLGEITKVLNKYPKDIQKEAISILKESA